MWPNGIRVKEEEDGGDWQHETELVCGPVAATRHKPSKLCTVKHKIMKPREADRPAAFFLLWSFFSSEASTACERCLDSECDSNSDGCSFTIYQQHYTNMHISYINNRTGLTVWPVLLSTVCSQSPLTRLPSGAGCSAGETGERVRGSDTDVYAPHTVFPLQLQYASQQSEATYDPVSITPAAARATWPVRACMFTALPTHKLFVHVGLDYQLCRCPVLFSVVV